MARTSSGDEGMGQRLQTGDTAAGITVWVPGNVAIDQLVATMQALGPACRQRIVQRPTGSATGKPSRGPGRNVPMH